MKHYFLSMRVGQKFPKLLQLPPRRRGENAEELEERSLCTARLISWIGDTGNHSIYLIAESLAKTSLWAVALLPVRQHKCCSTGPQLEATHPSALLWSRRQSASKLRLKISNYRWPW